MTRFSTFPRHADHLSVKNRDGCRQCRSKKKVIKLQIFHTGCFINRRVYKFFKQTIKTKKKFCISCCPQVYLDKDKLGFLTYVSLFREELFCSQYNSRGFLIVSHWTLRFLVIGDAFSFSLWMENAPQEKTPNLNYPLKCSPELWSFSSQGGFLHLFLNRWGFI